MMARRVGSYLGAHTVIHIPHGMPMITRPEDMSARPPSGTRSTMIDRNIWSKDSPGPRVANKDELLTTILQAPSFVQRRHPKIVAEAKALVAAAKAVQAAQIPKEPRGGRDRGRRKK